MRQLVKKFADRVGFSDIYRSWYFQWRAPKSRIVSRHIAGVNGQWQVQDYQDLVYVTKTAFGVADETQALETMLTAIQPGDVVYDVGAFIGLHTVLAAKKVGEHGHVVAFEPHPDNYERLVANVRLNGLQNVLAIKKALGNTMGLADMKKQDMKLYSVGGGDGTVVVAVGDATVDQLKLPQPNVVKIDVEGFEYEVIRGLEKTLRQPSCRLVICEIHPTLLPPGVTVEMIEATFQELGFHQQALQGRGTTFHVLYAK